MLKTETAGMSSYGYFLSTNLHIKAVRYLAKNVWFYGEMEPRILLYSHSNYNYPMNILQRVASVICKEFARNLQYVQFHGVKQLHLFLYLARHSLCMYVCTAYPLL